MVAGDVAEVLVGDAQVTRLHQVRERAVVVLQAELAQAEERVRGPFFGTRRTTRRNASRHSANSSNE